MTFMLGSFTQGLTQGAKDIYGLQNEAAQTRRIRADADAQEMQTKSAKAAGDAARKAVDEANAPQQPVPQSAINATPSDSGPAGGGPGTTTNGPVAPLDFLKVPQPAYMPAGQQSVTESAPGSASGFGPSYNAEVGPTAAAQGQTPTSQMPMPSAPTLASDTSRTQPVGLGGGPGVPSAQPQQTFNYGSAASPSSAIDPNVPMLKQLDKIDSNTPLLKQWFGGSKTPAPEQAGPPAPVNTSPHRLRENAKQTSSNNIGRHLAGALNIG